MVVMDTLEKSSRNPVLSIVSVSYKSRPWLESLWKTIRDLNPGVEYEWLVIQNTPEESRSDDIRPDDPRFHVIEGPVLTQQEGRSKGYGSFHHAKALMLGYLYARSGIILTIDPDFFILYPDWIQRTVSLMQGRQIAFWGAGYPSRRLRAYRDFPMASCMFVNREQLHRNWMFNLDFSPDCDGAGNEQNVAGVIMRKKVLKSCSHALLRRNTVYAKHWRETLRFYLTSRWRHTGVDTEGDTGCKVYREFYGRVAHECLTVYANDPRSRLEKFIDALLPEHRRLYPRSNPVRKALEASPFRAYRGIVDEYFLGDALFAIHIGAVSYRADAGGAQIERLLQSDLPAYVDRLQREMRLPSEFMTN